MTLLEQKLEQRYFFYIFLLTLLRKQSNIIDTEAEEKARKAISQHIGEVGDKVDLDAVLEKRAWFDVPSFRGFGTDTMYVFTFRDDAGNALVWKTSRGLAIESGTKVHLTGTIKAHDEYKEEKQTILTRCKVKAGE